MYTDFAYIYDKLMHDVDYKAWADYIEAIFRANGLKPKLVLDIGCGTGNFCIEMAKRGYEMIGIDISPDMLSCAKTKSAEEGVDILYLNQDMAEFELYGTVDAIVCLMDSINYLTSKNDVKKLFRLVRNYLNPGGLFVFDINTKYKLEKVLGNNVFYEINDDVSYIWQNMYDSKKSICEFDLTFFVKNGENYTRYDEVHTERAYGSGELKQMVIKAGMKLSNVFDNMSFDREKPKSEKVFFVCKK